MLGRAASDIARYKIFSVPLVLFIFCPIIEASSPERTVETMSRTGSARKTEDYTGNFGPARASLQALVAEARAQQHHGVADRLEKVAPSVRQRQGSSRMRPQSVPNDIEGSLVQLAPRRRLRDLVLPADITTEMREFIDEVREIDLLRSHGLEPRHKVLFVGPPGTGKTSLAEVLASELKLPFFVVRYDGLIASYLGETATRLRKLIDYVSERPCVLFFDEFDTIGKERGDAHDTGEIKRVVSSLLLQMDSLPSHSLVVCATNHPELLDRAVWRRFHLKVEVPLPGRPEISRWFHRLVTDLGCNVHLDEEDFIEPLIGSSFSDIESLTLNIRRKLVLSRGSTSPDEAIRAALAKIEKGKPHLGGSGNSGPSDSSNSTRATRAKKNTRRQEANSPKSTLL